MTIDRQGRALQPLWQRVLNLCAGTGLLVSLALLWAGPADAVAVVHGLFAWLLA